jgi:histidinol dehydrogenase
LRRAHIFNVGGAQAIAALAFGTESVAKVDKIFGPGNAFVTEAKRQVSQRLDGAAIDMPAGPSEVLVIADSGATPDFVASDLLSQAEHGPDSQVILLTPDAAMGNRSPAPLSASWRSCRARKPPAKRSPPAGLSWPAISPSA